MTLLEVLVSIFVLAVGLIGVASMLPIASRYSSDANKYDRAATLAQAIYHDLQLHRDVFSKSWLDTFVPPPALAGHYAVQPAGTNSYLFNSVTGTPFLPPVIIDPLAIGYAAVKGQTPPPLFPAFPVTTFPLPGQQLLGAPAIYRLTLDSNQAWPSEDPVPPSPVPGFPLSYPLPMTYAQADRLFRSNDDVAFRLPANADLRPANKSMPDNGSQTPDYQWTLVGTNGVLTPTNNNLGNLGNATPDFEGDFTWLLTVAPDIDDVFQQNMANMDRFTVSVVVIQKRDLNLDQTGVTLESTTKKAPPERMVFADLLDVSAQANAGIPKPTNFGGGAVRLRTPAPSATSVPPVTAAWLDVRPNEWLMLTAFLYDPIGLSLIYAPVPGVPAPGLPIPVVQWYRIAGVGDTVDISGNGSGPWYRDVQLAGPDWNNTNFSPNLYTYPAGTVPGYPVQYQFATLVTGTVAVYNNMIIVDGSLLKD